MITTAKPLPKEDLAHVLEFAQQDLEQLRGARLFVTGGTGFFGKWLLATFQHANRELRLGASMTVLTRDPARFRNESPHLSDDPAFTFHAGDVRTFDFPAGKFSHIIHGASGSGSGPLDMFATIVRVTWAGLILCKRLLDMARASGQRSICAVPLRPLMALTLRSPAASLSPGRICRSMAISLLEILWLMCSLAVRFQFRETGRLTGLTCSPRILQCGYGPC